MKKILVFLVILSMVFSFTNCGTSNDESNEGSNPDKDTGTSESTNSDMNTDTSEEEEESSGGYWVRTGRIAYSYGKETGRITYTYDEHGRLIDSIYDDYSYRNDDFWYAYKYDENGRVAEEIVCTNDGQYAWTEYTYQYFEKEDGSNTIKIINRQGQFDTTVINFDSNKLPISEYHYYNGELQGISERIFYGDGFMQTARNTSSVRTETSHYSYYRNSETEYEVHQTDEKGFVTIQIYYTLDEYGNLKECKEEKVGIGVKHSTKVTNYQYDENNLLVGMTVNEYDDTGKNSSSDRYVYIYDEHQNLIKEEKYQGNYGSVPCSLYVYTYEQIPMTEEELELFYRNEKLRGRKSNILSWANDLEYITKTIQQYHKNAQ